MLEIGDLSLDRFRGILRLGYQGDAWIEVRCRVQANPLSHNPNLIPSSTLPISTPLLASQPLLVPMTLRLSKLHLRAILILVVSASKGITLVFKNDPLQNVDVSSTFDSVEVIRGYLQQEIEGQLREMFREDLPGIIHRLSQRWFSSSGTTGTVETPYRDVDAAPAPSPSQYGDDEEYDPTAAGEDIFGPPNAPRSSETSTPRRRAVHRIPSSTIRDRQSNAGGTISGSPTSYTVFPDIENYDPTYGLRPEGLPTHSGYEAFGRLWEKARGGGGRGLGSLMDGSDPFDGTDPNSSYEDEETYGEEDEEESLHSGELLEMDDLPTRSTPRSPMAQSIAGSVEWESFPAVGGGMVTRPRVYHAQSQIRAPSESGFGPAMPSPAGTAGTAGTATGSVTARASSIGGGSTIGSLRGRTPNSAAGLVGYHPPGGPGSSLRRINTSNSDVHGVRKRPESLAAYALHQQHALARQQSPLRTQSYGGHARASSPGLARTRSNWDSRTDQDVLGSPPMRRPASLDANRSRSTTDPRPPPAMVRPRERTTSFGTNVGISTRAGLAGITLPLNNSVSQLATLSLSANTLSPYARAHEHIAVRSFPYLGRTPTGSAPGSANGAITPVDNSNVKARRKRIFRLGSNNDREPSLSPESDQRTPPLDWDDETRLASSSSEGASRWRLNSQNSASLPVSVAASVSVPRAPVSAVSGARASSKGSYGFPKIPE